MAISLNYFHRCLILTLHLHQQLLRKSLLIVPRNGHRSYSNNKRLKASDEAGLVHTQLEQGGVETALK